MRLTKNFTFEELIASATAANLGIANIPDEWSEMNLVTLATSVLQPIRDKWGDSIIVNSGFRCQKLNTQVGGVGNSDHLYGAAADIRTKSNDQYENERLYKLIREMVNNGQIRCRQLINENHYDWIHISIDHSRCETKHFNQFIPAQLEVLPKKK